MLLIYRGQCSAGIIAQAITRACTKSRTFAAPYPLSRLLAVSMPSGPRDASQTLYAMAAQAKWRSRCRHQPAEFFSESWSVQCPVSMSLMSQPPADPYR